jgi:hypothetical protein
MRLESVLLGLRDVPAPVRKAWMVEVNSEFKERTMEN